MVAWLGWEGDKLRNLGMFSVEPSVASVQLSWDGLALGLIPRPLRFIKKKNVWKTKFMKTIEISEKQQLTFHCYRASIANGIKHMYLNLKHFIFRLRFNSEQNKQNTSNIR